MAFLQIQKVLESTAGVKKDGAAFIIPEELDATVFVALGHEILQIPRLSRVELGADLTSFVTHKNERFFFPPDQVVGLRVGGPEAKAGRTGAGFLKTVT
jgi:hypothetical protein